LSPGAKAKPASASVLMAPSLLFSFNGTRVPLGITTKNSEVLAIGPIGVSVHPPLGVVVPVRATMWKMIVALPLFQTDTERELGVKLAAVSWNRVMSQMASR